MKRISILIVLISLITVACTTMGPSNPSPRYPNYPNYPPNYPGYPSPYPGGGSGRYGGEQLRTMADSLELAADRLERDAIAVEPAIPEADLDKIKALHDQANTFLHNIDDQEPGPSGPTGPSRTNQNFQTLLKPYYDARDVLKDVRDRMVQDDFDRVSRMMRNIANLYGYRLNRDENVDPMVQ